MKNEIAKLINKDMDRRSFLQHIGFGVIMLLGISSLVDALGNFQTTDRNGPGYGDTNYGN